MFCPAGTMHEIEQQMMEALRIDVLRVAGLIKQYVRPGGEDDDEAGPDDWLKKFSV